MNKRQIYRAWRNAGFLSAEVRELVYGSKGVSVDAEAVFKSRSAATARFHRGDWIRSLRDRGWSNKEIIREARAYYIRDTKRSPWDFIRAEYKPRQRKDFRDYRTAARARAKAKVKALYR